MMRRSGLDVLRDEEVVFVDVEVLVLFVCDLLILVVCLWPSLAAARLDG